MRQLLKREHDSRPSDSRASLSIRALLRRLIADEGGEVLTIIAIASIAVTALIGGSQVAATMDNSIDQSRADTAMIETADALQAKFEASAVKGNVPKERADRLYRRWNGMRTFANKTEDRVFWEFAGAAADISMDVALDVTGAGVAKGAGVLVKSADAFWTVKDPFDVYSTAKGAFTDNSKSNPELFAFTKEMIGDIDGREGVEDFMTPVRKTAAANMIGSMTADVRHANALPGAAAPIGVVRERLADAVATQFAELKKSGAIDKELSDDTYEQFVRDQVRATDQREAGKAAVGELTAFPASREAFDGGKCNTMVALLQTEDGAVLVRVQRDPESGKISAATLATKDEVVVQGDEPAQPPVETPGEGEFVVAGTYEGVAHLGNTTASPTYIEVPFRMEVATDGSFTATIQGSGPTPADYNAYYYISKYKFDATYTGTISAIGVLSGTGTYDFDTFFDSRGDSKGPQILKDKAWMGSVPVESKLTGRVSSDGVDGKTDSGFPIFEIKAGKVD